MTYLRNRYYDSSTGRFITEDPAQDGLNWYSYCAGDPVNAVDPWGLRLTASVEDSETILQELEKLTDDDISFVEDVDENGIGTGMGQFVITKTYDTYRHVGQTLISDLINSSEIVNINIGVDSEGNTNTEWPAYEDIPMQIYIDPNNITGMGLFTTYVQDDSGNVLEEEIPSYIVFGHELIHSWRDIKGIDVPNRDKVGSIPQDAPQLWREEELQTMGINYTVNGVAVRDYETYEGIMSENGLRLENELNTRVSYYYAY